MKKAKIIVLLALVLALCLMLSACNMGIGMGKFSFHGIHVCDYAGNCRDLTVVKWYDNSEGIEINTKEAGSMFCSEGTYILYENECPICGANKEG